MDLVRSWVLAAAVYLALNFTLSVTVGYGGWTALLYALCPFLAGIAASTYHAERGTGGWGRHLLAVLPVPLGLEIYGVLLHLIPRDLRDWGLLLGQLGTATLATAAGLGVVMLTRLLLASRSEHEPYAG